MSCGLVAIHASYLRVIDLFLSGWYCKAKHHFSIPQKVQAFRAFLNSSTVLLSQGCRLPLAMTCLLPFKTYPVPAQVEHGSTPSSHTGHSFPIPSYRSASSLPPTAERKPVPWQNLQTCSPDPPHAPHFSGSEPDHHSARLTRLGMGAFSTSTVFCDGSSTFRQRSSHSSSSNTAAHDDLWRLLLRCLASGLKLPTRFSATLKRSAAVSTELLAQPIIVYRNRISDKFRWSKFGCCVVYSWI
mmetsp:Transcript_4262/g.9453  ORF Transcript_4262/g.9453 Transcript_4262/m.9453 type:complete len:242 (-) Transcript_4262:132-857(-)